MEEIKEQCREKKTAVINEKTLVPIGMVIVIIGGIAWITNMSFQTNASAKTVEKVVQRLDEISDRLARIEGKMGIEQGGKR